MGQVFLRLEKYLIGGAMIKYCEMTIIAFIFRKENGNLSWRLADIRRIVNDITGKITGQ
jgi:hypothetical protein